MQTNNLKRNFKNKKDRLIGRGGKHAKTSGRGGKGQTARAGNKRRPELRDIIKKLPKKRGYQFQSYQIKPVVISLDKISAVYPKGGDVNPTTLLELKALKKKKGVIPMVKILNGKNPFNVKVQVSECFVSDSANDQIVKALGSVLQKGVKSTKVSTKVSTKEPKEEKKQKKVVKAVKPSVK